MANNDDQTTQITNGQQLYISKNPVCHPDDFVHDSTTTSVEEWTQTLTSLSATFTCYQGYRINGTPVATCDKDGEAMANICRPKNMLFSVKPYAIVRIPWRTKNRLIFFFTFLTN